jgi:O-antigen/teichoic acid export membrane protein
VTTGQGTRGSYRAGFFFGALSFGATLLLGFASTVVTARVYGITVIGDYALVIAPVSALWVLSTVKEQQALIKEITTLPPRDPRVTQLFAVVFVFSTGLTLLVAGLIAVGCVVVYPGVLGRPELLAPALVSIAGYALVTNTGWNLDSVLSAFVAGKQLFRVRLNEALSFIVIAVALGLLTGSVWGLVAAAIGSAAVALVHRLWAARAFVRPRLTREEFRLGLHVLPDLLRFGLRATPGQIANGISQQGGIWAIGIVAPVNVVGAYSRALVIPKSVQQASMKITEVLFPTLVDRHTSGDGHGFDRALIDSIRYEVVGMLLLAATLGGTARTVLGIFGSGFDIATPALVLLLFFPVLASITITQTQALWAVNRPGVTSTVSVLRLLLTLVLLVLLTPKMNFVGPALALLCGTMLAAVLFGWALRDHLTSPLRATWPVREWLALAAAYGAGFASAHIMQSWLPPIALPLSLAGGSIAFVAALWLFGGINGRDRQRLRHLAERIGPRLLLGLSAGTVTAGKSADWHG